MSLQPSKGSRCGPEMWRWQSPRWHLRAGATPSSGGTGAPAPPRRCCRLPPPEQEGWEGSDKGGLNSGVGDRACAGGCCQRRAGNSHACRDSGRERCPSNPDLICFIPRTINPSSLPMVPYQAAEARTGPLKLTITQSECLFGVIQARGKVREGRRKARVSFLQDIASPAALKWCLNKMDAQITDGKQRCGEVGWRAPATGGR